MKKLQKGKYFILGFIISVLISNLVNPAMAALVERNITVSTGVSIYVDGVKLNPTDANGRPVEPFIYNGTTYLPVRAIANAFDKAVSWDGRTSSVYLGMHDSDRPALYLQDLEWFTGRNWIRETENRDNLGNIRYNNIHGDGSSLNNIYRINGRYRRITGTLYQPFDRRNGSDETAFEIYGDETLLYSARMRGGIDPIDFSVDISGVLELRVRYYTSSRGVAARPRAILSEVGLWQ